MKQDFTRPLEIPGPCLRMWTIYQRPTDYPDHYVVRGQTIRGGHVFPDHALTAIVDTLEDARAAIPRWARTARIPRDETDEPQIVETWF